MAYKYKHFIPQNTAPSGAKSIGVYNSNGEKVCSIPLGRMSPPTKEKLYSFGLVSDIHLYPVAAVEWYPERKFRNALTYFQSNGCAMCIVCGDLTQTGFYRERTLDDGTKEKYFDDAQMMEYKNIREEFTMPVYALCGNHENYNKNVTENLDELENVIGVRELSFSISNAIATNRNVQVTAIGNDVFILCGQPNAAYVMSDADFTWLSETLEANKDKRCFVFIHAYIEEDSGDPLDVRENSIFEHWGTTKKTAFINLLNQYNNVILFHGHSHMKFKHQEHDVCANYTDKNGFKSVHIPSLATPRDINFDTMQSVDDRTASEGYIVDVYDNCIVLNGMDLINNEYVPLGVYKIGT